MDNNNRFNTQQMNVPNVPPQQQYRQPPNMQYQGGYNQYNKPPQNNGSNKTVIIILIVVLSILCIAFVVFACLLLNDDTSSSKKSENNTVEVTQNEKDNSSNTDNQQKYGNVVTSCYDAYIFVRTGPGKEYTKVMSIAPGDTSVKLKYTGTSQYGNDGYVWYNVLTPNNEDAWVRSDIVQFD